MAKKLSPVEKKASQTVLGDLRKHMQGMLSDKMKGMKKVTVASDSKEGLEKGLSKAEEIIKGEKSEKCPDCQGEDCSCEESEEESESPEMEESEDESEINEMSEEELDAKIKELMSAKAKLSK